MVGRLHFYILYIYNLSTPKQDYDELPGEAQKEEDNSLDLLKQKVQAQALLLQQANEDMAKMRLGMQRILEKDSGVSATSTKHCVGSSSLKADESYFSSYAHFGIHHEMLSVSSENV